MLELLDDAQRVGVLRPDRDLDAVQPGGEEAVVDHHGDRARHHPAPGVVLVEPVADRGELRRAAHDVVDRHLAGEPSVHLDRERERRPLPGLPGSRRTSCLKLVGPGLAAGRHGRVPRHQPRRVALPGPPPGVVVGGGQRPQRHLAVDQPHRPPSVVTADHLLDRVHQHRLEDGDRVLHPAAGAGQVDHEAAADHGRPGRGRAPRSGPPCSRRRRGSPRPARAPRRPAAAG